MKKSFLLFHAIQILSSSQLHSQKIKTPTASIKQEIDKYIKSEMKTEQIPGLAYAVVSDGRIIDSGYYGWANVELKAPVTSPSLFNIGSIGKTFTATAIMLLQKEGKLSIDDPIMKYLDSLPDSWKNITIKHLLTHTSGIKDYAHDFPGYPFIEKRPQAGHLRSEIHPDGDNCAAEFSAR
jgi:CubicO group peptidase (beta-lactamase class C family)